MWANVSLNECDDHTFHHNFFATSCFFQVKHFNGNANQTRTYLFGDLITELRKRLNIFCAFITLSFLLKIIKNRKLSLCLSEQKASELDNASHLNVCLVFYYLMIRSL